MEKIYNKNNIHAEYSGEQSKEAAEKADEIFAMFAAFRHLSPNDAHSFELVKIWQKHINKYYYECPDEILGVLGQLYVSEPDFINNVDRFGVGTAKYMGESILEYCKSKDI